MLLHTFILLVRKTLKEAESRLPIDDLTLENVSYLNEYMEIIKLCLSIPILIALFYALLLISLWYKLGEISLFHLSYDE